MVISNLQKILSYLNRKRKEKFPGSFVRRKKYENLQRKYLTLVSAVSAYDNPLRQLAKLKELLPFSQKKQNSELCIFVSYVSTPRIKPHVAKHIQSLLASGIEVVLVINTDSMDMQSTFHEGWMEQLSGLYIRENVGFDFSAWSHIYRNIIADMSCTRLYLINDSIVGPLCDDLFNRMLMLIRSSSASFVGLTENIKPRYHLQSFFLVINEPLLKSDFFVQYFKDLWAFPTKEMVIDIYETNFTQVVQDQGFEVEAIFSTNRDDTLKTDNVLHQLDRLFDAGFPYIKVSVLDLPVAKELMSKHLPNMEAIN